MKSPSSKFRVKIDVGNLSVNPSRFWYLVNPEICSNVTQLKQDIVNRFQLLHTERRLEVTLNDFVVPDDEEIHILQPDDTLVLRLRSSKLKKFLKDLPNGPFNKQTPINNEFDTDEKKSKPIETKRSARSSLEERLTLSKVKRNLMKDMEQIEQRKDIPKNKPPVSLEESDMESPRKKRRRRRKRKTVDRENPVQNQQMTVVNEVKRSATVLRNLSYKGKHLRFDDDCNTSMNVTRDVISSEADNANKGLNYNVEDAIQEKVNKEETPNDKPHIDELFDLTKCTNLVGPPRPNDWIAFKILELSETYSPELSSFKVAKVVVYNPDSFNVTVEFDHPQAMKIRKGKFELVETIGEENGDADEMEEDQISYVSSETYQLSDLFDVKLLPKFN